MKVLYLRTLYALDLQAGGSVAHTSGVINALDKVQSVELEVISNSILPGVRRKVNVLLPIIIPFLPDGLNELLYNLKVFFKLRKYRCDVIYHRHSGYSFSGALLSWKIKSKYVLEYNGSEVWMVKHWSDITDSVLRKLKRFVVYLIKRPIISLIEFYNLRSADLIIVVSEPMKEELMNRGILADKILVNPNGIDPEIYNPYIDGSEIRARYGFDETKKVCGFIGTFGHWHGVIELANAIVKFYSEFPHHRENVRFILIGEGALLGQVKRIISQSPYKDYVIFTGVIPQEQAPKYLAACDIFLSPHVPNPDGSRFFGSPTKLFEYMGMGKPIIASNLEQIGEILEHKRTAYLVEPGNIGQLVNAINILVSDQALCKMLGENAHNEVINKYTWEKHVSKILDVVVNLK